MLKTKGDHVLIEIPKYDYRYFSSHSDGKVKTTQIPYKVYEGENAVKALKEELSEEYVNVIKELELAIEELRKDYEDKINWRESSHAEKLEQKNKIIDSLESDRNCYRDKIKEIQELLK